MTWLLVMHGLWLIYIFPALMGFRALLLQGFVIEKCVRKGTVFSDVVRNTYILKDLVFS